MRLLPLLLIAFSFCTVPAFAQSVPIPQSKKEALGSLDKKLKSGKASKKELEADLHKIEKDLKGTQKDLVKTADAIQNNEKALQNLDIKIINLESEQKQLQDKLQKDRGSIAKLILALERIRRLPPEAMIARPETPLKTAQSAMLMRDILPALNKQAEELKKDLERLSNISENLRDKRGDAAAKSKKLKAQQKDLKSLVDKRSQLYASTQNDLEAQQRKIKKISAQSKNLQDLVRKLEDERTRSQKTASPKSRIISNGIPKAGEPRLPLPGFIKTAYNEPDNFGAPSKGLDIEGRAGALVVAPMGGTIRFAGHFKNYGNMVIIEHEKGWHSLVAGLENIDTVVGQNVSAGEPLGVLHNSASGQKPVLYYELRHKGKPVNPARKFSGLG